jgi:nitrogen fixation protein FixH
VRTVIAIIAVAALGAVVGAIWVGVRYHENTVVADPYEAGVHHDEARHAAERLGWTLEVDEAHLRTGPGGLRLALRGRDGAPVDDAEVRVRLSRAGTSRLDRSAPARPEGEGRYVAAVELPEAGFWDLGVTVRRGADRLSFDRRIRVAAAEPACDVGRAPCEAEAGGTRLGLELSPRPVRALADLAATVTVTRGGAAVEGAEVAVELSMPGMYMGENRAALRPAGPGRYQGRVVVLRCASGRTDWVAEVVARLPGGGEARARFPLRAAD